jgi:hypothetical protein
MSLQTVSNEILFNILLNLSCDELVSYCSTNSIAQQICNDDYFWFLKSQSLGINIAKIAKEERISNIQVFCLFEKGFKGVVETAADLVRKKKTKLARILINKIGFREEEVNEALLGKFTKEYFDDVLILVRHLVIRDITPFTDLLATKAIISLKGYNDLKGFIKLFKYYARLRNALQVSPYTELDETLEQVIAERSVDDLYYLYKNLDDARNMILQILESRDARKYVRLWNKIKKYDNSREEEEGYDLLSRKERYSQYPYEEMESEGESEEMEIEEESDLGEYDDFIY